MKAKSKQLIYVDNKLLKKSRFHTVECLEYKDGIFEAGLVKNSPHKSNTVYLRQGDIVTHLTFDEALAIIRCLSMALWCSGIFFKNYMPKIKWKKYSEVLK